MPSEPPAKLRCFDPADWPDPADWAEDAELIDQAARSGHALADPVGWWACDELAEHRREARWEAARQQWADDHDVDPVEWLYGRLVPVRRGQRRG